MGSWSDAGATLRNLVSARDVAVDRPIEVGSELVGIRDVRLRDRVGPAVELIEPRAGLVVVDRCGGRPTAAATTAATAGAEDRGHARPRHDRAREGPRVGSGRAASGNGSDGSPGGGERWCATMPVSSGARAPIV